MKKEWFAGWFDSPYYHLLYNHRNDEEAGRFIDNLCSYLKLPAGARIWDIACGKGRHSNALNRHGYTVTGTDLAPNSILLAAANAPGVEFAVHDMRKPFREDYFDAAVNLFTSIGYFADFNDNFLVFKNVATALRPGGRFVVDFLNAAKVKAGAAPATVEKRGEIEFCISRKLEKKSVVKTIAFEAEGESYLFEERVTLLDVNDFHAFAGAAQLKQVAQFGNYDLAPYNEGSSDRLILIFEKTVS